jgi:hypothetical protein
MLARQVAAQVETLTSYARERQEAKPLNWAIQYLSTGPENRLYALHVLNTDGIPKDLAEKYEIAADGNFRYSKILSPTYGEGIKLKVRLGYTGFLGTRSSWVNDLLVCLVFCVIFNLLINKRSFQASHSHPKEELKESDLDENHPEHSIVLDVKKLGPSLPSFESTLRNELKLWQDDARSLLMQLGIHVRNLMREAKSMAVASGQSRGSLEVLSKRLIELSMLSQELQEIGLTEPSTSPQLQELTKRLQNHLQKLSEETQSALDRYSGVSDATKQMNEHISKATDTLIQEAKMIQKLKESIDSPAVGRS